MSEANENEYTSKGVRYVAAEGGYGTGCKGCAHESTFSTSGPTEGCQDSAECRGRLRAGGKNIIWVVAK